MFSPSYWDPFSSLGAFGFRADPTLGELRRQAKATRGNRNATHFDYREAEQSYVLAFDVPGLTEADFELDVHGQMLTVKAERKNDVPEGFNAHRVERPSFRLAQSFTLPTRIDVEKVVATLEHGVLTITLPKAAEATPRRIEVQGVSTHPTQNEVQS